MSLIIAWKKQYVFEYMDYIYSLIFPYRAHTNQIIIMVQRQITL